MKLLNDFFYDWEQHVFGYGYGSGENYTIPLLKRFIDAIPMDSTYDYKKLEDAIGNEQTWLLINILCHADIIEYGSSPRFGWLTPNGKKLQEFIAGKKAAELIIIKDQEYYPCSPDYCNCGDVKCNNPFWLRS